MDLNELENVPTYGVGFPTLVSLADYRAALDLIRSQQELLRAYRDALVATENRFRFAVQGRPVKDMDEVCSNNANLLSKAGPLLPPIKEK